jgi:sugar lactone lactonase YvrE
VTWKTSETCSWRVGQLTSSWCELPRRPPSEPLALAELASYADLSGLSDRPPGNEIVVDCHGSAYVNGGGFDLLAGEEPAPGMVALVTPDGSAEQVAGDAMFPNGMAITADDSTPIVAEPNARRLTAFVIAGDGRLRERHVWADLGDGLPDGICIDAEGAVWYADVPNACCVRVREDGEVLQTVELDRGAFARMLGGPRSARCSSSRASGAVSREGTARSARVRSSSSTSTRRTPAAPSCLDAPASNATRSRTTPPDLPTTT